MACRIKISEKLHAVINTDYSIQLERNISIDEAVLLLKLSEQEFKDLIAFNTRYKQGRIKDDWNGGEGA